MAKTKKKNRRCQGEDIEYILSSGNKVKRQLTQENVKKLEQRGAIVEAHTIKIDPQSMERFLAFEHKELPEIIERLIFHWNHGTRSFSNVKKEILQIYEEYGIKYEVTKLSSCPAYSGF